MGLGIGGLQMGQDGKDWLMSGVYDTFSVLAQCMYKQHVYTIHRTEQVADT